MRKVATIFLAAVVLAAISLVLVVFFTNPSPVSVSDRLPDATNNLGTGLLGFTGDIYNTAEDWLYRNLLSTPARRSITVAVGAVLVFLLAVLTTFVAILKKSRTNRFSKRIHLKLEREFLIWRNKNNDGLITCTYCRRALPPDLMDVEHKIPLVRGGANSLNNLHLACRTCNVRKGSLTHKEFKEKYQPSDLA